MRRLLKEKPSYSLQARGSKGRFYFLFVAWRGVKGRLLDIQVSCSRPLHDQTAKQLEVDVDGAPGEPGFQVWNRDRGLFRWE